MHSHDNNVGLSEQFFTLERLNAFEKQVTELIPRHFAYLSQLLFPTSDTASVTEKTEYDENNTYKYGTYDGPDPSFHYKAMNDNIFTAEFYRNNEHFEPLKHWVYGFSKLVLPEEANMSSGIRYNNMIPAPENIRDILEIVIRNIERNSNPNTLKIDLKPEWFDPDYHTHDINWKLTLNIKELKCVSGRYVKLNI